MANSYSRKWFAPHTTAAYYNEAHNQRTRRYFTAAGSRIKFIAISNLISSKRGRSRMAERILVTGGAGYNRKVWLSRSWSNEVPANRRRRFISWTSRGASRVGQINRERYRRPRVASTYF